MATLFALDGLVLEAAPPLDVEVPLDVPLVEVLLEAAGLLPGAVNTVPFWKDAAVAGVYAAHVAFSAIGQVESWQIAWISGAADAGMDAAAEHRDPKALVRAPPTAVASSIVTPKLAAESPTWVMK